MSSLKKSEKLSKRKEISINNLLFQFTVRASHKSYITDPPSEILELSYPLPPIPVIESRYNPLTNTVEEINIGCSSHGWTQMTLPEYRGVKVGDKIKIFRE